MNNDKSEKMLSEPDPDITYNLQRADQAGKDWIQRVEDARNRGQQKHPGEEKKGNGRLFENVGAILTVMFFIYMILSYYAYIFHWFADIFTGKCSWWSLGFICRSV